MASCCEATEAREKLANCTKEVGLADRALVDRALVGTGRGPRSAEPNRWVGLGWPKVGQSLTFWVAP